MKRVVPHRAALVGAVAGFAGVAGAIVAVVGGGALMQTRAVASQEALEATGGGVYVSYCQTCHGDKDGLGRQLGVPSHGRDGHTWHHSDRNLKDIILNGPGEMAGMMGMMDEELDPELRALMRLAPEPPKMPAWKGALSEQQVDAVIAYIKTFWTPEERRFQQDMPMMQ